MRLMCAVRRARYTAAPRSFANMSPEANTRFPSPFKTRGTYGKTYKKIIR
jgi:hypothetical protein